MENQVPEDVVKDRFSRLLTLVQEKGRENSSRFQGTIQEILVEDENREKGTLTGRTQHNLLVHFPGEKDLIGKYVKVSPASVKANSFIDWSGLREQVVLNLPPVHNKTATTPKQRICLYFW